MRSCAPRLMESLKHPKFTLPQGNGNLAVSALLKEWMKRDYRAAVAWLHSVKSATLQEARRAAEATGPLSYRSLLPLPTCRAGGGRIDSRACAA